MKAKNSFISLLALAFLFGSLPLMSQNGESGSLFDPIEEEPAQTDFSLDVGTSFTSFSGSGGMFTNSIAPRLNWDTGKNFHLEVGTVFSSSRYNGLHGGVSQSMAFQPGNNLLEADGQMFSSMVYAIGSYRVSPRLSIHGGTWMERNSFDMREMNAMNPQAVSNNPQGMMMGFDYKITENLRFGAEVNFSTGYNPYNPAYMHQSPFGGRHHPSPFHRRDRW